MPVPVKDIYDVIIAGGGPAGASAAYVLAKAGKKVLIVEKEKLPRYKTCGGGLTFKGLNLIPFDINEIIEKSCYVVNINDFEANVFILTKREKPVISMTMRSDLDYHLIKAAEKFGAEVKDGAEIKDINISKTNVEVILKKNEKKFYSGFLIAADGALSVAAKKYFGISDRKLVPALEYEVHVADDILSRFENIPRFDFGIVPGGYGWVFPKKDHLSIGVLSMNMKNGNMNNYFSAYLNSLRINKIKRLEKHGFVIPLTYRKVFAGNRILLIGDAAGFIDPITAEGISFAVQSGQIASEALIKGNMDTAAVYKEYNDQISKKIIPELKAGKILAKFVYGYRYVRIWIVRLYGEKLSELMTDVIMGEKKYSELVKDPLNYLKLLVKWSFNSNRKQKFFDNINNMQTSS